MQTKHPYIVILPESGIEARFYGDLSKQGISTAYTPSEAVSHFVMRQLTQHRIEGRTILSRLGGKIPLDQLAVPRPFAVYEDTRRGIDFAWKPTIYGGMIAEEIARIRGGVASDHFSLGRHLFDLLEATSSVAA